LLRRRRPGRHRIDINLTGDRGVVTAAQLMLVTYRDVVHR